MASIWAKITRKKAPDSIIEYTSLRRCLTTVDLTFMGMGAMIGSGIYVMTGIAAKELAGPGIALSFIGAAVAISLAAVSFTEFASRVSKTGSVYLYAYLTLGELCAFLLGWSSLLVILFGGATNARVWSGYLDSLFNNALRNFTESHIGQWKVGEPLAEYPDFAACVILFIMTIIVATGVKCSARFTTLLAGLNVCILLFVIIVGFVYADVKNWTAKGYLPFGWSGVVSGSAACFWALTGFEIIAVSVEEAKDPVKSVPRAMAISVSCTTLLYIGVACALTLVTSYEAIDTQAPLPSAFASRGIMWAKYIVAAGPLCGLTTSLFSSLFSFVRVAYAMSQDGLLFGFFSRVNSYTKVPVIAGVIAGSLMTVMALFLQLKNLVSFSIVLNLVQYMVVEAGVIILRYNHSKEKVGKDMKLEELANGISKSLPLDSEDNYNSGYISDMEDLSPDEEDLDVKGAEFDAKGVKPPKKVYRKTSSKKSTSSHIQSHPTTESGHKAGLKDSFAFLHPIICSRHCVAIIIPLLIVVMTLFSLTIYYGRQYLRREAWWTILIVVVLALVIIILGFLIFAHRQSSISDLTMKVPCVPLIPSLGILVDLILMVFMSSVFNWVAFGVVLVLGLIIYFAYGMQHSKENREVGLSWAGTQSTAALLASDEEDDI